MKGLTVPTALPVIKWDTVPPMAACPECAEQGFIAVRDPKDPRAPFLKQCPTCDGVARDMIPWTELFTSGIHFIPLWMRELDDDGYDYENEDEY